MLMHRGFSAWIMCDGETVPEHLVAIDENAHRVQCWIPSEAGKTFSVYWRDHDNYVDTCSFIDLDGFVVPGRFLFGTGVAFRSGVRTGTATERPFTFATVEEADTEGVRHSGATNVGMITLKIKRIERLGSRDANGLQSIPPARGSPAAELCVKYGDEMETFPQYPHTWQVRLRDKPSTWVSFTFRYRSRAFLVAQGIMPDEKGKGKAAQAPTPRPQRRPTQQYAGITQVMHANPFVYPQGPMAPETIDPAPLTINPALLTINPALITTSSPPPQLTVNPAHLSLPSSHPDLVGTLGSGTSPEKQKAKEPPMVRYPGEGLICFYKPGDGTQIDMT